MKKIYIIISLFICFLSFLSVRALPVSNIIVIDPGHGGMDIGASIGNVYESDLVLEISFKIKEVFEKEGYFVILTRENKDSLCDGRFIKKEDMNKRVDIINNSNALLALSIHLNKFSIEKYQGAQVFYSRNSDNEKLAKSIQDNLRYYLGNTKRDITKRDNIFLLNRVSIPCCLIECGFMSNKEEFLLLKNSDYQYKLAYGLLLGVNDFLK